jgi:hypothetical protein
VGIPTLKTEADSSKMLALSYQVHSINKDHNFSLTLTAKKTSDLTKEALLYICICISQAPLHQALILKFQGP